MCKTRRWLPAHHGDRHANIIAHRPSWLISRQANFWAVLSADQFEFAGKTPANSGHQE